MLGQEVEGFRAGQQGYSVLFPLRSCGRLVGTGAQAGDSLPLCSSQPPSWLRAANGTSAGDRSWLSKKCALDDGPYKADARACGSSLGTLPRTAKDFRAPFHSEERGFFSHRALIAMLGLGSRAAFVRHRRAALI